MIRPSDVAAARVLLVAAPVGYGKSAFAEQVLARHDLPIVRVRPVPDLTAAQLLTRALRRAGRAAAADACAAEPDAPVDAVLGALGDPVQVFINDAHRFEPDTVALLAELVADLPTGCRAVVCGRDLTAFAMLRARLDVAVVNADDLRLGEDDVVALLGEAATRTTARELIAATEGWPAAVDLAVSRVRREPRWSASGSGGVRALLRNLVDEVVRADPRLPLVARLPLFDAETLALIGPGDHRGLDLPSHEHGRWRVIPAVVRDLVGTAALPPAVALAVAEHYHRGGETAAALDLLREQNPAALVAFAADLRWDELAELDAGGLRQLVDGLGPPYLDAHARILLNAAKVAEFGDRTQRARWLTVAGEIPAATPATARAVSAEHARDVLRSGEVDRGAALAGQVLAAAAYDEPATRARALVTLGMRAAYDCTPDSLASAARTFTEAADLYRRAGEARLRAETLARLGYTALYIAGFPAEGADAMSEALALLPVGDLLRAFWLTCYADVLNVLGRYDESDAAVREALDIGARRHDPTTSGMAWWTVSWNAALRGDAAGLHEALAQVERHRGGWLQGGQEAEYLGSSAENLLFVGDLDGYRQYAARAERLGREIDYPEVVTTPRAYFEAEHGDPAEAQTLLDELERIPGVAPVAAARRSLFRALAHRRAGDDAAARESFTRGLEQARGIGVPDLLHRMHPRIVAAVTDSVDARATDRPAVPSVVAHLQLLGRFALTVPDEPGGREGAPADRTPPPGQPAALVKLLALRGTLTTEEAIDALWPGTDVGTARARLRNLLNRLKERSGAVIVRDGEALRLSADLRIDAVAFEQATASALSAPGPERVGRARHALALYTGELLPGDLYESWADLDRDRLRRRYVSLADLVAADCIERGELDEGARLLDVGIAAEPRDESRPLQLCALLVQQGRAGAAGEVARRCVAALAELGVAPSAALRSYSSR